MSWEIDAFPFELPAHRRRDGRRRRVRPPPSRSVAWVASPSSTSRASGPATTTRRRCSTRSASSTADKVTVRLQEIYQEPIKPELVTARHPRDPGRRRRRRRCGHPAAHRPADRRHHRRRARPARHPGHGRVGRARLQEPASRSTSRRFVRDLDLPVIVGGCASYQAALHLMRTGAAGVLVGVGAGHACTTDGVLGIGVAAGHRHRRRRGPPACATSTRPASTATSSPTAAWDRAATSPRPSSAAPTPSMIGSPLAAAHEAPGRGFHWGMATFHPTLPRGARGHAPPSGAPSRRSSSGRLTRTTAGMNLFGALRTSMATCGYETIKELQKAELMVAPVLQTEGKTRCSEPRAWAIGPTDRCAGRRRVVRHRPGRRLRRPVRAAHRPTGARGPRLLRDRPAHDHGRRDPGPAALRASIFSGGPQSVHVDGRADHRPRGLRPRRPDPGHLLRRPAARPRPRWRRSLAPAGASTAAPTSSVVDGGGLLFARPARRAARCG